MKIISVNEVIKSMFKKACIQGQGSNRSIVGSFFFFVLYLRAYLLFIFWLSYFVQTQHNLEKGHHCDPVISNPSALRQIN